MSNSTQIATNTTLHERLMNTYGNTPEEDVPHVFVRPCPDLDAGFKSTMTVGANGENV